MLEDVHSTALSQCRTTFEVSCFSDECLNKHKYTPNLFQEEHAVTSAFGFELMLDVCCFDSDTSAAEHTKNSSLVLVSACATWLFQANMLKTHFVKEVSEMFNSTSWFILSYFFKTQCTSWKLLLVLSWISPLVHSVVKQK